MPTWILVDVLYGVREGHGNPMRWARKRPVIGGFLYYEVIEILQELLMRGEVVGSGI
jgi:hypothetical protein